MRTILYYVKENIKIPQGFTHGRGSLNLEGYNHPPPKGLIVEGSIYDY